MNQLSKEAKQLIEEIANIFGNLRIRHGFKLGAEVALTTPVLLEKQGLISLEDAMLLYEWANNNGYKKLKEVRTKNSELVYMKGDDFYTTSQLFQIYKQQKL